MVTTELLVDVNVDRNILAESNILLPAEWRGGDWNSRISPEDEEAFYPWVKRAWDLRMNELMGRDGRVLPLEEMVHKSVYPSGLPKFLWTEQAYPLVEEMRQKGHVLYGMARAQTLEQAYFAGAIAQAWGVEVVLAVGDVPEQKSDRETVNPKVSKLVEIPMVRGAVDLICKSNVSAGSEPHFLYQYDFS